MSPTLTRASMPTFTWLLLLASFSGLGQGQADDHSPHLTQGQPALQVTSNLVLVRVVVRDDHGNPVEGLKKDNFKVFDRGKEQTIAQFEEHSPSSAAQASGESAGSQPSAGTAPDNFIALYFDDQHTSELDLAQARDAVDRYLAAHLQPQDRVAIFTSGGGVSSFTSDLGQIREALLKVRASPRAVEDIGDCPHLSEYEATEIIRTPYYDDTNDAWKTAMFDATRCLGPAPPKVAQDHIRAQARRVVDKAQMLERSSLGGLELAVKTTAHMPGRRTVIMVSPGFVSESEQAQLNRIIDQALRSQVVVSSLDPAGVVVGMRVADSSQSDVPTGALGGAARSLDQQQQMLASGVLTEVADGTGGSFFHNNNDLGNGFRTLLGSPAYYILAFSPTDLKQNGKFHALKVTVSGEPKGIQVQARRGYFAAPNQPEATVAETEAGSAPASQPTFAGVAANDTATHEQLREALFAKTNTSQLAVNLETKIGSQHDLSAVSHLDGKDLPFRTAGGSSVNTVTFLFAVFDGKGTMLDHQQKHVDLVVPEGQMPAFVAAGVSEDAAFQLKPGTYRLREVVVDAVAHRMTSLSRTVMVP